MYVFFFMHSPSKRLLHRSSDFENNPTYRSQHKAQRRLDNTSTSVSPVVRNTLCNISSDPPYSEAEYIAVDRLAFASEGSQRRCEPACCDASKANSEN